MAASMAEHVQNSPSEDADGHASPCWEDNVLPVFYYNDMLIDHIGARIGLNLFEPRYQEMCKRMTHDPRFIFMPNFKDYCCMAGDVGFVVRLSRLEPNGRGNNLSYGIAGEAVEMICVSCAWVEPQTNGLHFARYWHMDPETVAVTGPTAKAVVEALRVGGWRSHTDGSFRELVVQLGEDLPGSIRRTALVVSQNWPDRVFLLALPGPGEDAADAKRLIGEVGATALGVAKNSIVEVLGELPSSPAGVPFLEVLKAIEVQLRTDGPERFRGMEQPWSGLTEAAVQRLLSKAQLSHLKSMVIEVSSCSLEQGRCLKGHLRDCFPMLAPFAQSELNQEIDTVYVHNGANVLLLAPPEWLCVSARSAAVTLLESNWLLNRWRLRLLQRAKQHGQGPFALLPDHIAEVVSNYVATEVPEASHESSGT